MKKYIIAAFCIMAPTSSALATTYNWLSWSFPTSQTATANIPSLGTVDVSVQGSTTATYSNSVLFNNVTFTPTTAPTAAIGKFVQAATDFQFITTIDLTSFSNTTGLILGFGNFGYGAGIPSYQLKAFDFFGAPMPLTGFTQIGSYDNAFSGIDSGINYNDDVFLNLSTGIFEVTTISGGDNNNSDTLLLQLGTGVGHLEIAPVGGNWVTGVGGDSIHVLAAAPESNTVPEPSSLWLLSSALASLIGFSRRNVMRRRIVG